MQTIMDPIRSAFCSSSTAGVGVNYLTQQVARTLRVHEGDRQKRVTVIFRKIQAQLS